MIPHGIMFHHFHDRQEHRPSQGSISADDLRGLITFYEKKGAHITGAGKWLGGAVEGTLKPWEVVLTFDDGIACQYDIAVPVLDEMGLTACWFVNGAYADGLDLPLEIFRQFRHWLGVDAFYEEFFRILKVDYSDIYQLGMALLPPNYLASSLEYTPTDRRFRYFRDIVLGPRNYEEVMWGLIRKASWEVPTNLSINHGQLEELIRAGHIVGMHSYSHPHNMKELPLSDQYREYTQNLEKIPRCGYLAMSHPSGSYSKATLRILEQLGVQVGFRADMEPVDGRTNLEFPRVDHAMVMKEMRGEL